MSENLILYNKLGFGRHEFDDMPNSIHQWIIEQDKSLSDACSYKDYNLLSSQDILGVMSEKYDNKDADAKKQHETKLNNIHKNELYALLDTSLKSNDQFTERLMWFWFNHFTVSEKQNNTQALIGSYIREAIKPNMMNNFSDMLIAVIRHPAMLRYLDNINSIGPNSKNGVKTSKKGHTKGLNENLARECMELHSLSPESGYTQTDVTNFANILTGWSVDNKTGFKYKADNHEPGEFSIMNNTFTDGQDGGIAALKWMGTNKWTYRHISKKILIHFVSDRPDEKDIEHLTSILLNTNGNLLKMYIEMIKLPSFKTREKFKNPLDYTLSLCRSLSIAKPIIDVNNDKEWKQNPVHNILDAMNKMGMPLFKALMPNGWSDMETTWISPSDVLVRIDWAYTISGHHANVDPLKIANSCLGNQIRPEIIESMSHAPSVKDALTILFSSSEFQRR